MAYTNVTNSKASIAENKARSLGVYSEGTVIGTSGSNLRVRFNKFSGGSAEYQFSPNDITLINPSEETQRELQQNLSAESQQRISDAVNENYFPRASSQSSSSYQIASPYAPYSTPASTIFGTGVGSGPLFNAPAQTIKPPTYNSIRSQATNDLLSIRGETNPLPLFGTEVGIIDENPRPTISEYKPPTYEQQFAGIYSEEQFDSPLVTPIGTFNLGTTRYLGNELALGTAEVGFGIFQLGKQASFDFDPIGAGKKAVSGSLDFFTGLPTMFANRGLDAGALRLTGNIIGGEAIGIPAGRITKPIANPASKLLGNYFEPFGKSYNKAFIQPLKPVPSAILTSAKNYARPLGNAYKEAFIDPITRRLPDIEKPVTNYLDPFKTSYKEAFINPIKAQFESYPFAKAKTNVKFEKPKGISFEPETVLYETPILRGGTVKRVGYVSPSNEFLEFEYVEPIVSKAITNKPLEQTGKVDFTEAFRRDIVGDTGATSQLVESNKQMDLDHITDSISGRSGRQGSTVYGMDFRKMKRKIHSESSSVKLEAFDIFGKADNNDVVPIRQKEIQRLLSGGNEKIFNEFSVGKSGDVFVFEDIPEGTSPFVLQQSNIGKIRQRGRTPSADILPISKPSIRIRRGVIGNGKGDILGNQISPKFRYTEQGMFAFPNGKGSGGSPLGKFSIEGAGVNFKPKAGSARGKPILQFLDEFYKNQEEKNPVRNPKVPPSQILIDNPTRSTSGIPIGKSRKIKPRLSIEQPKMKDVYGSVKSPIESPAREFRYSGGRAFRIPQVQQKSGAFPRTNQFGNFNQATRSGYDNLGTQISGYDLIEMGRQRQDTIQRQRQNVIQINGNRNVSGSRINIDTGINLRIEPRTNIIPLSRQDTSQLQRQDVIQLTQPSPFIRPRTTLKPKESRIKLPKTQQDIFKIPKPKARPKQSGILKEYEPSLAGIELGAVTRNRPKISPLIIRPVYRPRRYAPQSQVIYVNQPRYSRPERPYNYRTDKRLPKVMRSKNAADFLGQTIGYLAGKPYSRTAYLRGVTASPFGKRMPRRFI